MRGLTVHLVQCLCPARHCIMAVAFEEPPETIKTGITMLKDSIEGAIEHGKLNPYCGLCSAPSAQWTFEVRTIEDTTLSQVEGLLRQSEREQLAYAAAVSHARKASIN